MLRRLVEIILALGDHLARPIKLAFDTRGLDTYLTLHRATGGARLNQFTAGRTPAALVRPARLEAWRTTGDLGRVHGQLGSTMLCRFAWGGCVAATAAASCLTL